MGGLFGALGDIGAAQAGAVDIRRQRANEQAELAIKQRQQAISEQYAKIAQQRLLTEQDTERRLQELQTKKLELESNPQLQAQRDRAYLRNLLNREPTSDEMARWAKIAPPFKISTLKQVRDDNSPTGWSWQAVDEATGLPVITQKGAPAPSGSDVVTDKTTHTDPFSGITTTHEEKRKVAPGAKSTATAGGAAAKPFRAPAKASPATQDAIRIKAGVAPSPAFYDDNGKIAVPRQYWSKVDELAKALRDGAIKIGSGALTPKNWQLTSTVMARARELGWAGGPPPTSSELDAARWARKGLAHMDEVRSLISSLDSDGKLGPLAGRYQEFMAGKVGSGDERYVKLRGNVELLTTALMRQHVGARGGFGLLNTFQGLWQPGQMTARNLNAALDVMQSFMESYSHLDEPQPIGGGAPPKATSNMNDALDSIFGPRPAGVAP